MAEHDTSKTCKNFEQNQGEQISQKFIARRGDPDFINEWALLKKAPKDNKAKMFQAMLRQMVISNRLIRTEKPDQLDKNMNQLQPLWACSLNLKAGI